MKLSIVVPAFNERHRLGPMLQRYVGYFTPCYKDEVEFIVVVNGSTDGTADAAREAFGSCPAVRIINEPRKIGKGAAVRLGFEQAKGALIGFVDADGSTPPNAFQALVDHIGTGDAIIASRWRAGSRVSPKQPLARRVASRIFNGLVRLFFGLRLTDTQCGAKLMKREALQRIGPKLGLTRWAFDVDLLFQFKREGYKILEVPTEWHDAADSKLNVVRASFEMFVAMCRLRLLYSPFRFVVRWYDVTLGRLIHLEV